MFRSTPTNGEDAATWPRSAARRQATKAIPQAWHSLYAEPATTVRFRISSSCAEPAGCIGPSYFEHASRARSSAW